MARKTGADTVHVEGLAELRRDLKLLGPELPKEMSVVNRRIAQRETTRTKQAARELGSTAAHVVAGIRRSSGQAHAGIKLDADSQPAILGAEFGGGRRPTTHQFKRWRGSGSAAGYFLWPTIRRDMKDIGDMYLDGIDAVLQKTGWRI